MATSRRPNTILTEQTHDSAPCQYSEYGGSFEAGAGTLRLYVHAVALARAAADAAQAAMEKDFQAIDALKERLQVLLLFTRCVILIAFAPRPSVPPILLLGRHHCSSRAATAAPLALC